MVASTGSTQKNWLSGSGDGESIVESKRNL